MATALMPARSSGAEGLEVGVEAGLLAVVGDVLDGAAGDVIDQGQVGMTLAGRFLVHPDEGRDLVFFGGSTPGDGPLHDAPALVPARLQDVRRPRDVGLFEHVDGEALEGPGEAAARLGPGKVDLAHPVGRAVDPGRPGVQPSGEPAGVEVAPGPLFGVVVERQLDFALRAGPQPALVVRDDDVHSPVLDREVDVVDEPRVDQTEHLGVELDVTHRGLHPTGLRILPERHPKCRSLLSPLPRTSPGSRDGHSPSENRSVSGGSQRPLTSERGSGHARRTPRALSRVQNGTGGGACTPTPGFATELSNPRH